MNPVSPSYETLREEIAARVIRDPDCKECLDDSQILYLVPQGMTDNERDAYCEGGRAALAGMYKAFGFVPNAHNAGHHRPCAACRERRPYAWLKDVSLEEFTARVRQIETITGGGPWELYMLLPIQLSGTNPVMRDLYVHLTQPIRSATITHVGPRKPIKNEWEFL